MTGQSHRGRRTRIRRGLTLVELLVTVTIMGMVVAISVPIIKPMLASNKTKSGADIVAGFLAQARNRAIEENRPVGVTFERVLNYKDVDTGGNDVYPYNGACVTMRQVAEPRPLSGFVRNVRVAVDCTNGATGEIHFCDWNGANWSTPSDQTNHSEYKYWHKLVEDGDQIQFDAKGPKYTITKNEISGRFSIAPARDENSNLPWPVYTIDNPAMFKVFRKPQPGKVAPTMARPIALPEGIVVDLDSSGMGTGKDKKYYDEKGDVIDGSKQSYKIIRDDFRAADAKDTSSVTIMFSPTGQVDRVYYSNSINSAGDIPAEPIFLNVGIWERAGYWDNSTSPPKVSNMYLPDEPEENRNYHDLNNYWVTIFPQNGQVRVNRVTLNKDGPPTRDKLQAINYSRKYATSLHGTEVQ